MHKGKHMHKFDISKHGIQAISYLDTHGYDPEMLFVECAKCGNPIIWEPGRTTEILEGAGIDPIEIDAQCLLISDGCPRCSAGKIYHVQIFRVQSNAGGDGPIAKAGHS